MCHYLATGQQVAIAVAPLVLYISGLVSTFSINYINKWAGQYVSHTNRLLLALIPFSLQIAYLIGLVFVWIGL